MHFADGVEAVARGRDDLELPSAVEQVLQHAPHQRAVVGDQDARPPFR